MIRSIPAFLLAILLFTGCAPQATQHFITQSNRPADATRFFQELDKSVEETDGFNQRRTRVEGFPYLATNRFLLSLKEDVTSPLAIDAWLTQMAVLSKEARHQEIMNLPWAVIEKLCRSLEPDTTPSRELLNQYARRHADTLLASDKKQEGLSSTLENELNVPDDYSIALRVVGIYPIAAIPFAYFSNGFFNQLKSWHQTPPDQLKKHGQLTAFRLRNPIAQNTTRIDGLFHPDNLGPLDLPQLSDEDRKVLAQRYAPAVIQDIVANYDRIGQVQWQDSNTIRIDTSKPTAYFYLTNAYLKGEPIWQINYVFWYEGRLGDNTPWFERGLVDGITLRVSLDREGRPFMVDLMNNCACSHQFFPRKQMVAGLQDRSFMFDALVPTWLPDEFPEKPVEIRVNTGWHQVQAIGTETSNAAETLYDLLPYEVLEALPVNSQDNKSIFDADGIVHGSDRVEPYFFFPMGISNVGAMRQRGHHPVALIGRAHFDDPYLFDLNFKWH